MDKKILIVDDEVKILRALKFLLEDEFNVFTSEDFDEALDIFKKEDIFLVLLDLRLKNNTGFELMKKMLEVNSKAVIIIMTAYSTIENSIEAIKSGAYYFITKPIDEEQLVLLLRKAYEKIYMLEKINSLEGYVKKDLIGNSEAINNISMIINKVKDTNATILITGESGTGKELVAQKIHRTSNRANQPFIAINCAAMPSELLESELFGYAKGAFTGAYRNEVGLIRRADKGTLLLDEIGDMDLNLQSKLLRFMQEKEVRQVGGCTHYDVDIRIICVTNKDLKKEVQNGNFREDLYYRINVINIDVPPLRDRIEDLKPLILYFINKYNISFNKEIKGISDEAYEMLTKYNFDGNVRELENIIQSSVLLSTSDFIEKDSLNISFQNLTNCHFKEKIEDEYFIKLNINENMKDIEKKILAKYLQMNNQNRKRTAECLGISERSLRYKIKEYNL